MFLLAKFVVWENLIVCGHDSYIDAAVSFLHMTSYSSVVNPHISSIINPLISSHPNDPIFGGTVAGDILALFYFIVLLFMGPRFRG